MASSLCASGLQPTSVSTQPFKRLKIFLVARARCLSELMGLHTVVVLVLTASGVQLLAVVGSAAAAAAAAAADALQQSS